MMNRRSSMKEVLTSDERAIIKKFLTSLIAAYKINPKLNVSRFMKEYRNCNVDAEVRICQNLKK